MADNSLSLRGHCALCYRKDIDLEKGHQDKDDRDVSFVTLITRYLNLRPVRLALVNDDSAVLNKVGTGGEGATRTEIKYAVTPWSEILPEVWNLCSGCEEATKHFGDLYCQIESLRMLLIWRVKELQQRISSANTAKESVQGRMDIEKKLENDGINSKPLFKLLDTFREEIMEKVTHKVTHPVVLMKPDSQLDGVVASDSGIETDLNSSTSSISKQPTFNHDEPNPETSVDSAEKQNSQVCTRLPSPEKQNSANETPPFSCNVCKKAYLSEADLMKHINEIHRTQSVTTPNDLAATGLRSVEAERVLLQTSAGNAMVVGYKVKTKTSKTLQTNRKPTDASPQPMEPGGIIATEDTVDATLPFQRSTLKTSDTSNPSEESPRPVVMNAQNGSMQLPAVLKLPESKSIMDIPNEKRNAPTEHPYKCRFKNCSKNYKMRGQLLLHMKSHRIFFCRTCGKSWDDAKQFKRHKMTHATQDATGKVCQLCPLFRPAEKKSFLAHFDNNHEGVGGETKSNGNTSRNQRAKEPSTSKTEDTSTISANSLEGVTDGGASEGGVVGDDGFRCNLCYPANVLFPTKNILHIHYLSHDSNIKSCTDCPRFFKSAELLDLHRSRVHHLDKLTFHKCNQCDRILKTKAGLVHHTKKHDRTRRALVKLSARRDCRQCWRKFSSALKLRTHMIADHNETRLPTVGIANMTGKENAPNSNESIGNDNPEQGQPPRLSVAERIKLGGRKRITVQQRQKLELKKRKKEEKARKKRKMCPNGRKRRAKSYNGIVVGVASHNPNLVRDSEMNGSPECLEAFIVTEEHVSRPSFNNPPPRVEMTPAQQIEDSAIFKRTPFKGSQNELTSSKPSVPRPPPEKSTIKSSDSRRNRKSPNPAANSRFFNTHDVEVITLDSD